jgi:hypothetical protein
MEAKIIWKSNALLFQIIVLFFVPTKRMLKPKLIKIKNQTSINGLLGKNLIQINPKKIVRQA